MAELNLKGKAKLELMGFKERFQHHTPMQKSMIKEHGGKMRKTFAIMRALNKKK